MEGILELFKGLKVDYCGLDLETFTREMVSNNGNSRFEIFSAVCPIPGLQSTYSELQNYKNTVINRGFPLKLREENFQKLKYRVDEIISTIESGSVALPKRRISDEVVNLITDPKLKQICIEINKTPDENILSLSQNVGEALKWTLWFRAKQTNTSLKEKGNLGPLLNEAISRPYFRSNSATNFLRGFRDNFLKTSYDMVRHSESYIPNINLVNPQLDALEQILRESFT